MGFFFFSLRFSVNTSFKILVVLILNFGGAFFAQHECLCILFRYHLQ